MIYRQSWGLVIISRNIKHQISGRYYDKSSGWIVIIHKLQNSLWKVTMGPPNTSQLIIQSTFIFQNHWPFGDDFFRSHSSSDGGSCDTHHPKGLESYHEKSHGKIHHPFTSNEIHEIPMKNPIILGYTSSMKLTNLCSNLPHPIPIRPHRLMFSRCVRRWRNARSRRSAFVRLRELRGPRWNDAFRR